MRNWLLPEYIDDLLPPEAERVEALRRTLLDLLRCWGYDLVQPPLLEHVESLLTGTGRDLDLRTFKLVDQLSGRMLGLRADITPQIVRIDAHLAHRAGVARYGYCGSVLHTLPDRHTQAREIVQLGAEVFGHAGVESDIEIQRLMLAGLARAGIRELHLDLGHVAVFGALAGAAGLDAEFESDLFRALQAKDRPRLVTLTAGMDEPWRGALRRLPELYGDASVLERARAELPALPELLRALDDLTAIAAATRDQVAGLHVDLAELRGYHYHSGAVFAAYTRGQRVALAAGGRYDGVGQAFGRARPATGFSLDLRALAAAIGPMPPRGAVRAPWAEDAALAARVAELRAAGEVVVCELPGTPAAALATCCDRRLVACGGGWDVVPADDGPAVAG
jgi:ATP phosphoribosyltransferase regulatory subunit